MSQPAHANNPSQPHIPLTPSPPLSSVGYAVSSSSHGNALKSARMPRGRALLLEHVPIEFLRSTQGALLIIYSNGDACLFPVNDQPKQSSINSVKVLSKEGGPRTKIAPPEAKGASSKYHVYDIAHQDHELYTVYRFKFPLIEGTDQPRVPRKIQLSSDKCLLLMIGVTHKGHSCLVVYQLTSTPDYFRVIFYDLSQSIIDACISPDSNRLVVIPSKHPSFLFVVNLPIDLAHKAVLLRRPAPGTPSGTISTTSPTAPTAASGAASTSSGIPTSMNGALVLLPMRVVSFEPRFIGNLSMLGPARGVFGQPLKMTHITANTVSENGDSFHFITWNDEGFGEYCIWTIHPKNSPSTTAGANGTSPAPPITSAAHPDELFDSSVRFEFSPRLLMSRVPVDKTWLEGDDSPKNHILDVQFSPVEANKAMMIVKRTKCPKAIDNGIGMQMLRVESNEQPKADDSAAHYDGAWYRVKEPEEKANVADEKDVLAAKWSRTLLLGTAWASACVVRGKGLFELVDFKYGSAFQALYDPFVQSVCNFVQLGDYRRFWVSSPSGALNEIAITPQLPSAHPEWRDLFVKEPIDWNMRGLGRCVGYFINDISKDSPPVEIPHTAVRKQRKGGNLTKKEREELEALKGGDGAMEKFYGLHLYRCWHCKRVLLKPLQCGQCLSAAYCSKECQRDHWSLHRPICVEIREKNSPNKKQ